MSGRVWRVVYEGSRRDAMVQAMQGRDWFRSPGTGAIWQATATAGSDDNVLIVELYPVNAHTLAPQTVVADLPAPSGVLG